MYGAVPPVAVTVIVPLEPPKHETFVLVAVAVRAVGCVIVVLAAKSRSRTQRFTSLI